MHLDSPFVFALVAMEGPDPYSRVGGLATRLQGLAEALVHRGITTHHFFIGDPGAPAIESRAGGLLFYHRWAQWLSAHHSGGVYDGEDAKAADLAQSLPESILEGVIEPAVAANRLPVVLAEEWQTTAFLIRLDELLRLRGLRDRVVTFWNANNPYGFDRIDWQALTAATRPLAVSRFMWSILRARGIDSVVIPNGLPGRLIGNEPDGMALRRLGQKQRWRTIFFKMARWEREKGWGQALDAMAELSHRGRAATLVARAGGSVGKGEALAGAAAHRGLEVVELSDSSGGPTHQLERITAVKADVVNLRFPVSEPLARLLFAGTGGVLANSIMEPFGLVGLEAMAAGGVVFTGGTGEDYAVDDLNAVVLKSTNPGEIADRALALRANPERVAALRSEAKRTASGFTWDATVDRLLSLAERRREE